jgi:hypothetical protein
MVATTATAVVSAQATLHCSSGPTDDNFLASKVHRQQVDCKSSRASSDITLSKFHAIDRVGGNRLAKVT